jgi:hypothetical protein
MAMFSMIFKRHGTERFQGGEWTSQCVSPPVRPQQGPGPMQQSRARYCTMRFRLLPAGRSRIGLLRNRTTTPTMVELDAIEVLSSGAFCRFRPGGRGEEQASGRVCADPLHDVGSMDSLVYSLIPNPPCPLPVGRSDSLT